MNLRKRFYKNTEENNTDHVPCYSFFVKKPLPSAIFNLIQCLQLGQFNISVFFVVCGQSVSIKEQNIAALDKVLSLNFHDSFGDVRVRGLIKILKRLPAVETKYRWNNAIPS